MRQTKRMQIKNLSKADYYKSRNIVVPKIQHKLPRQPCPPFNLNLSMPEMTQDIQRYLARRFLIEKNEIARMAFEPTYHKLGIDVQDLKKVIATREDQITILKSQREKDFQKISKLEADVFQLTEQLHKNRFEYKNYIELIMSSNQKELTLHICKITSLEQEKRKISEDFDNYVRDITEKYQLKSSHPSSERFEIYNKNLIEPYERTIEILSIQNKKFRLKLIQYEKNLDKETQRLENELHKTKNHLQMTEKELTLELLRSDRKNNETITEIQHLKQRIHEIKKQKDTQREGLIEQLKKNETYRQQIQQILQETKDKDQKLIQSHVKTISSLESKIIELKGIISHKSREISQMQLKIENLEFKNKETEMKNSAQMQRMNQSQNSSIYEAQTSKKTYEDVITNLELDLIKVKKQKELQISEIKKLTQQMTKKEKQMKKFQAENFDQDMQLRTFRENNKVLSQECKNLKQQMENLKKIHNKEKYSLEKEILQLKKSSSKITMKQLDQLNMNLKTLNHKIQQEKAFHQSEVNNLNKKIDSMKKEIEILRKERDILQQRNQETFEKYKIQSMDRQSCKTYYKEKIDSYRELNMQKNDEIEMNEDKCSNLQKENDQLQKKLQNEEMKLYQIQKFVMQKSKQPNSIHCHECVHNIIKFQAFQEEVQKFKTKTQAEIKEISSILEKSENEIEQKKQTILLLHQNNAALADKNRQLNQALLELKNIPNSNGKKPVKKNYRYDEENLTESYLEQQKKKKLSIPKSIPNPVQKPTQQSNFKPLDYPVNSAQEEQMIETGHFKKTFVSQSSSFDKESSCLSEEVNSEELNTEMIERKMNKNFSAQSFNIVVSSSVEQRKFKTKTTKTQLREHQMVEKETENKTVDLRNLPAGYILDQISDAFSQYEESGLFEKPNLKEIKPELLQESSSISCDVVMSEGSSSAPQQQPITRKKSAQRIVLENTLNKVRECVQQLTEKYLSMFNYKSVSQVQIIKKENQIFETESKNDNKNQQQLTSELKNYKESIEECKFELKYQKELILEQKEKAQESKEKVSESEKSKLDTNLNYKVMAQNIEKYLDQLDISFFTESENIQKEDSLQSHVEKIIKYTRILREKLSQQINQNQILKQNLSEIKITVETNQDLIEKMEKMIHVYELEKVKIQEQMEEEMLKMKQKYEGEVTEKKTYFLLLQNKIDEKTTELKHYELKLSQAEAKLKNQEEYNISTQKLKDQQIHGMNQKIQTLNQFNSELESKLTETESKLKIFEEQIIKSNEQMSKMKKQLREDAEKFLKETQSLRNELELQILKCKQNDCFKQQVDDLKLSMEKLRENNTNLNSKLDEMQRQHDQNLKEKDRRWEELINSLKESYEKSIKDLKTEKQNLQQKIEKRRLQHEQEIKVLKEKYEKYIRSKKTDIINLTTLIQTKQKEIIRLTEKSNQDDLTKELLHKYKVRWDEYCSDFDNKREVIRPDQVKLVDQSCIMYKSKFLDQTHIHGNQSNQKFSRILSRDLCEVNETREVKLNTQKKEKIFTYENSQMEKTVMHEVRKETSEIEKNQRHVGQIKEENSDMILSGIDDIHEFDANQDHSQNIESGQDEEQ